MEQKNTWLGYTAAQKRELEKLSKEYIDFLNRGKTERECVDIAVNEAERSGYRNLHDVVRSGEKLKKGDRIYAEWMGKSLALFNIGSEDLEDGLNILGAHIDSPRMDVKQNPLYEESELAYFDTHYYGGIKKYQWVTLPLAIHGVIVKTDGTTAEVRIGEDEDDPVFCVTDLLIHLAEEQMGKKGSKVVEGESLDLLIGSEPLKGVEKKFEKEAVKQNILKLLKASHPVLPGHFRRMKLPVMLLIRRFMTKQISVCSGLPVCLIFLF